MSKNQIIKLSATPDGFQSEADELELNMFSSELPTQHTHVYYEDESIGLCIGVWDTTDMIEAPGAYECDEFMWLLEGSVNVKNNRTGKMDNVQAGEAFVIPWGYDCQWHQVGYLRKFFVIYDHPEETLPNAPTFEGIIKPQQAAAVNTQDNQGLFTTFVKHANQKTTICYQDKTESFLVGQWQSESFNSELSPQENNIFVHLLEGTLILTDEEHQQHEFHAGDTFFIPQGTVCSWQSSGAVHLLFTVIKVPPH